MTNENNEEELKPCNNTKISLRQKLLQRNVIIGIILVILVGFIIASVSTNLRDSLIILIIFNIINLAILWDVNTTLRDLIKPK